MMMAGVGDNVGVVTVCCECGKVRVGRRWIKASDEDVTRRATVSHGYCPRCYELAMQAVAMLGVSVLRAARA